MRTVLDKVTIRSVKPTDFAINPEEIWIDVEIKCPNDHKEHLFIASLSPSNLKRIKGSLITGVTGDIIVITDDDYYYNVLAWKMDG